jgi:hypothetical protein
LLVVYLLEKPAESVAAKDFFFLLNNSSFFFQASSNIFEITFNMILFTYSFFPLFPHIFIIFFLFLKNEDFFIWLIGGERGEERRGESKTYRSP